MRWASRLITLGLLVCLSLAASADTLTGKVVKVADGDASVCVGEFGVRKTPCKSSCLFLGRSTTCRPWFGGTENSCFRYSPA